ncbi:MAG: acetyl-CoA carboxylase biotin carboxyl carrier protein [Chitinophagales bacterium]|nr:acetyl-CoA carboxylase biotin carboxyl carrier protein [Chitinophagales bacterium]
MELKEIQELIKMFDKSKLGELSIENGDFKLSLKTKEQEFVQMMPSTTMMAAPAPQMMAAPAPVAAAATTAAPPAPAAAGTSIKSPMVGTFYRSAGPDKPPFVKPGDKVSKGQVICIIEAMKLFNEIEAEMDGTIVKVLVDDASPVEYDQPLFIIE